MFRSSWCRSQRLDYDRSDILLVVAASRSQRRTCGAGGARKIAHRANTLLLTAMFAPLESWDG